MKRILRKIAIYIILILLSILSAVSYVVFVFPNNFAPSGFNGIATIIQHVFDINAGYLTILMNIPLIILVFIFVDKEFAVKTFVFLGTFSSALVLLEYLDLSAFVYHTESGTSTILGPIIAGIISGATVGVAVLFNCCSGGTDLCAALIHKYKPSFDFVWIAFMLNVSVAIVSYFVFGRNLEPVIMCIIYSYFTSSITDKFIKGSRAAIKFEVVTTMPNEVGKAIIEQLGHSATVIKGEGIYTKTEKSILFCIVNKDEIVKFKDILKDYPDTFAYASNVNFTIGKFRNPRPTNDKIA